MQTTRTADEPVKVFVRIRPAENDQASSVVTAKSRVIPSNIVPSSIQIVNGATLKTVNSAKEKTYSFDSVFGETTTQDTIYDNISHFVLDAVDGYNSAIFAYGSVASGKTFTMMGSKTDQGIVSRAIDDLFQYVTQVHIENPSIVYHIEVTFVEIYNNKIRNLLKPADDASLDRIDIHESLNLGIFLTGANLRHHVKTAEEAVAIVNTGNKARATSTQGKNASSRFDTNDGCVS